MSKINFKTFKNNVLMGLFEGVYYKHFLTLIVGIISRESIFQGNTLCKFLISTCFPLVVVLKSPHFNVHDFTEKTKTFYCPSGYEFRTKSKYLQQQTKRVCSLKSSCSWTMANGCSVPSALSNMGKWIMDSYFEVIIINLYSSEQKLNL